MTLTEQDQRQMIRAISDAPITFVHSSTTYTNAATMGALAITKPNAVGGFEITPDLTITTSLKKLASDGTSLTNRFSSAPAANQLCTVSGSAYRIVQTVEDEFGSGLVMDLINSSR